MGNKGISLGKLFGIEVRLDYTWFILFFLILISFTTALVPRLLPETTTLLTLGLGLILTFLLFISVLIHEFAHSLYAKRKGLKIERMTLFVFGGAAELQEEPKTPRQEFVMAGLGPLSSVLIAAFFLGVWLVGSQLNNDALIVVGSVMSSINVILAIFNLLPGFPLDGGRMLRAAVWGATNNFERATRIASKGGKLIAYLLIAYGLLQLLGGAVVSGIWLILIGFFLSHAASLTYQQTMARLILDDVPVKEIMSKDFEIAPRDLSAFDFIRSTVLGRKQTAYPVEPTEKKPAGIVTLEQLQETEGSRKIDELALEGGFTVHPKDPATKALGIISRTGVPSLPVVENSKLVGIISLGNIQTYLAGKLALRSMSLKNSK